VSSILGSFWGNGPAMIESGCRASSIGTLTLELADEYDRKLVEGRRFSGGRDSGCRRWLAVLADGRLAAYDET